MSALTRFRDKVRVEGSAEAGTSHAAAFLTNRDLNPVEPSRRTWTAKSFAFFWISDGVNLSTAVIVSSYVLDGLAWWQVWLAVWVGYLLTTFVVICSGRIGAVYHIGYPVTIRASFGIWGSIWPVLNRVATATLWTSYQSYLGGKCIELLLRSLAPQFVNLPNHLPASSGTTTKDFLCFFLFWLAMIPAAATRPEKIRHLFTVKAIIVPAAYVAFFAWSISDANGLGPIVKQPATLRGSALGWTWVAAVMGQLSNFVTLMLNMPDFSRLARHPKDTFLSQLLAIPLTFAITSFIGLVIASSSTIIFGQSVLNPLDLLALRLDRSPYDAGTRAGVFFISTSFALGQIGTNIAANVLSAGSDLTALLPRYMSIRRGGLLSVAIALAICPWKFAGENSSFSTYLSAYSVLLAPFIGVMLCDYYIVRRGFLSIPSLYTLSDEGDYRYHHGVHWRAYAAYIGGLAINIVGFAGAVGANVSTAASRIYTLAPLTGSIVAALVYLACCYIGPRPVGFVDVRQKVWREPKDGYEAADWSRPTEGETLAATTPQEDERVHSLPGQKDDDDEKMETKDQQDSASIRATDY